jgi:hypothetical protein
MKQAVATVGWLGNSVWRFGFCFCGGKKENRKGKGKEKENETTWCLE